MSLPIAVTQSGINLIAAKRLVTVILNIRKTFAGMLLGVIKKVNNNTYIGNGEFGDSYHVASGEQHFYQACYKDAPSNVDTDSVIVDDEDLAPLIDGCFDDDDDVLSTKQRYRKQCCY